MRNSIILPALFALSIASCSKSAIDDNGGTGNANVISASAVPSAVISTFNSSFSGATEVEWQRHSSSFEAQFNHSSQRHSAGFDDNGHQSSHSILCLDGPVPPAVLAAFRQNFPTDNVYEWKLRNDGTWRAHFMRGSVKWEATFSASGTLIKVEKA